MLSSTATVHAMAPSFPSSAVEAPSGDLKEDMYTLWYDKATNRPIKTASDLLEK